MENEIPATPVAEEEINLKEIRTIKINEKYEIKFLASLIKLYVQCTNEIFPYYSYANHYDLKNLIKIHKDFFVFEDIKDVCPFLKSVNKNSIKLDNKNEV